MTDIVERVARAIAKAIELRDRLCHYEYEATKDEMDEVARAAIAAMREPSNDMLQAMHEAMFEDKFDGTNLPMLGAGFEAAIDAAISEGKE
jgi:hypothetical protein